MIRFWTHKKKLFLNIFLLFAFTIVFLLLMSHIGQNRHKQREILLMHMEVDMEQEFAGGNYLPGDIDIRKIKADIEKQIENDNRLQIIDYKQFEVKEKHDTSNISLHRVKETRKFHRVWTWADKVINMHEMWPDTVDIDSVLHALRTAPIVMADKLPIIDEKSGTSEKWIVVLEGGQKAVMKIAWEPLDKIKNDSHCKHGYELPRGEIVGFHLHRLMGFRNTPYVTGRTIHIMNEIVPVATPALMKSIKVKSETTACISAKCLFCSTRTVMCPQDGYIKVSLAYWVHRNLNLFSYSPKFMPYSISRKNEWENYSFNNKGYCNKIRSEAPYDIDRYYHDLFDFSVIDTLMYNYDSKHYIIEEESDANGLTIRIDHGRAFCDYHSDNEAIFLAPIEQCCIIRRDTWRAIQELSNSKLSKKLKESLMSDPLFPILHEQFYPALDRRLAKIKNLIEQCAGANGGLSQIIVG